MLSPVNDVLLVEAGQAGCGCRSSLTVTAAVDSPWRLLQQQLQTGEVSTGSRVVSRYGSTAGLHLGVSSCRQQPLDHVHAAEAGGQVQGGGSCSVPVLGTGHKAVRSCLAPAFILGIQERY